MAENFATGRCLCGQVQWAAAAAPIRMVQCHCKDCQRFTGTGHISNAIFNAADVTVTGETAQHATTTDSGNTATRHFCPTCGSRVFGFTTLRPGCISIMVGTADDHSWFEPQAIVYAKRRPAWDLTRQDIPNFDEMPPAKPQV